jgi:LmbE family N-acetylglucosaminyl deacetylase
MMSFHILQPEDWSEAKKILVILAHPDDPEFFFGASIARWIAAGHEVHYCLLTRGDKGGNDLSITPEQLIEIRMTEQRNAARVLGVSTVQFLDHRDGFLHPNDSIRKEVIRQIRMIKPDIVASCDPTNYYLRDRFINHPDHRAAGEITLDAVFPAAGNVYYFPELITEENLLPHTPEEVWLSTPLQANVVLDVTEFWPQKLAALKMHVSQIGDPQILELNQLSRRREDSTPEFPRFEDQFRRLYKR